MSKEGEAINLKNNLFDPIVNDTVAKGPQAVVEYMQANFINYSVIGRFITCELPQLNPLISCFLLFSLSFFSYLIVHNEFLIIKID